MIFPDTQLRRLGLPPPENSKKEARLFFFDEANVSLSQDRTRYQGMNIRSTRPAKTSGNTLCP